MKKLILFIMAAGFAVACTECPPERFTTSSPEIESTKDLVADYENGDWTGWMEHYADTAMIYHNSPDGAPPADVMSTLQDVLSSFSYYGFDDDFMFHEMVTDDEGRTWVYFWSHWIGTWKESGETSVIPVHLALQYVNGKVVGEFGFYDMSEFAATVQAMEAGSTDEEISGGDSEGSTDEDA